MLYSRRILDSIGTILCALLLASDRRAAFVCAWLSSILSLIISDGFWFDTTKFRRVYTRPLKKLSEGLRSVKSEV